MKRISTLTFLAVTATIFSSCIEGIENKTVVHPDGSLSRTIIFTGDSSTIAKRSFKLRIDSSWKLSTSGEKGKSWTLTAEQTFRDEQTMNVALRGEPGKSLTAVVHVDKTFQWFFTSYQYTETWKCYRILNALPPSQFISDEELDLFYRHEVEKVSDAEKDSLQMKAAEKRFVDWRTKNLFEAYYMEFVKGVEIVHAAGLTSQDVERRKEELFQAAGDSIESGEKDVKRVQRIFAAVLRTPLVAEAFRANDAGFHSVVDALDFEESIWTMGKFKVFVTMPGVIASTNARGVEGSTAMWEDFLSMAEIRDIDLTVTSRSVNWWSVVLTGVIVLSILTYLTAALLRRRTHPVQP